LVVQGRSGSFKVDDFGTNRKRVCNFLLVGHCDYGPILHRFWDLTGFMWSWVTPPLFNPNFQGCSRCTRSPMLGVSQSRGPKLFGREIIFEEFQPMCCWYLNVMDGQTDRRLTVASPRSALASRGKNTIKTQNTINNERRGIHTVHALVIFSWSDTWWQHMIWTTDIFWFWSVHLQCNASHPWITLGILDILEAKTISREPKWWPRQMMLDRNYRKSDWKNNHSKSKKTAQDRDHWWYSCYEPLTPYLQPSL